MFRSLWNIASYLQRGVRLHSSVAYKGSTVFGPYYRWERRDRDNTDAIVDSRQLISGEGLQGRAHGVYSWSRITPEDLASLRRGGKVIEYFAHMKATEPNQLHDGKRAVYWTEERLGYEPLDIEVSAVYEQDGKKVLDEELHDNAKQELRKLGIELEE